MNNFTKILENLLSTADPNIKESFIKNSKDLFNIGKTLTEDAFKNKSQQEKEKILLEIEKIILTDKKE